MVTVRVMPVSILPCGKHVTRIIKGIWKGRLIIAYIRGTCEKSGGLQRNIDSVWPFIPRIQ